MDLILSSFAAQDTACAWLPELKATTSFGNLPFSFKVSNVLRAPLDLKAPTFKGVRVQM